MDRARRRMMGVLPLFHAFGLTGCLWVPLLSGIGAVYHANPLDAKTIGKLVAEHRATVLMSTPTFCQSYLRACEPVQFATVRHALVGAERLPASLAAAFQEKFGIALLEGYGCTEMGPVVAVNTVDVAHGPVKQTGHKPGTVGHPIPGVVAKVLDLDSGEVLPPEREGLLLVKGPGRMLGYLDNPAKTAEVVRDGWYVTGDRCPLTGFIRITDRLARFSKIGGEMVPHAKVEELLAGLPGVEACVVTAVADTQKGERLVALYTSGDGAAPADLWQQLSASDLPRLWLPKAQNLYCVESLPLLPPASSTCGARSRWRSHWSRACRPEEPCKAIANSGPSMSSFEARHAPAAFISTSASSSASSPRSCGGNGVLLLGPFVPRSGLDPTSSSSATSRRPSPTRSGADRRLPHVRPDVGRPDGAGDSSPAGR
jgi:acyl-CoA synthetase (AMP-forming)/AMP-acid ligase II